MNNTEFSEYVKHIKSVDLNGFELKIVDSVGVLLTIKLKRNVNHFDTLVDHIYANYFKNVSVEKIYILLEAIVKIIILKHCEYNIPQNIIPIEDVYTGETEILLVDFGDKIGNFVSDSHITNLQCKEMDIGFKQAFTSGNLPISLKNMYLMNI